MTSRPLPSNPNTGLLTKTRVLLLALTISASLVIIASILYFLYHLWHSLVHRAKTIPFDSSAPLKLQRFSYRELKIATRDFDPSNVIGKGGSGSTVFRGTLKTGQLIAVKRLDSLSLQTEREFQNELQILSGLRSPFLVTLLGYCVEKDHRVLVYEYMPNKSLQEWLFGGDAFSSLSWDKRFEVILDVARALEFLHLGCDPPVIHGDIKPSNVLLDSDHRAKISDFGLSRIKVDEPDQYMFSQDLGKSQELSGNSTTPAISTPSAEVDFSLALQASSSSKNGRDKGLNLKGKELVVNSSGVDCDWNHKFVPFDDDRDHNDDDEPRSFDHSKELKNNACLLGVDEGLEAKQWGNDWWWRQDHGGSELCSKDYVTEWIGSQICPSTNPDWDDDKKSNLPEKSEADHSSPLDNKFEDQPKRNKKRPRKMQEWWREEHLAEITQKKKKKKRNKNKSENRLKKGLEKMIKLKKGFKVPLFLRRKNFDAEQDRDDDDNNNGEFSFRRGWRKNRSNNSLGGSEMWSGDLLSTTTSMRGTLCYVAPEYGGFGPYLMEKADIYSLGVLILVIVSGRRPLHVLASPMKLEKANLVSWCRHLAQSGNVLELVDERLRDDYNKDQASLCINLALTCLHKMPELRPDVRDVVRILRGEMDLPAAPLEFSPSPPSRLYSSSRRKHKFTSTD